MRGMMYEWIVGIFMVFILALLFIILNEAYVGGIYDEGERIPATYTDAINIRTILHSIWSVGMPVLFLVLLLLYAIVRGQRRRLGFEEFG